MIPDDDPFILNEEEQRALVAFDAQVLGIQLKRVLYLREIAKRKGLTAPSLEELRSKSGKPFAEAKASGRDYLNAGYRDAVAGTDQAYFCGNPFSQRDSDGCGWVKGTPIGKKYDEIGLLSGSAGVRFYCKICGQMVGRQITVRS